jgi:hypothetical protein
MQPLRRISITDHDQSQESYLRLVKKGSPRHDPREPPLRIGDVVRFMDGPRALVVDLDGLGNATTAWLAPDGEMQELELFAGCFQRVSVLDQ